MAAHDAILFSYELNPEGVDFFFIPENSDLDKNLIGAIRTLDGLYINTQQQPQTELQWKAWEYVNAAMTKNAESLDSNNAHNQNRFHAALLPFKVDNDVETRKKVSFSIDGNLRFIRSGMIM